MCRLLILCKNAILLGDWKKDLRVSQKISGLTAYCKPDFGQDYFLLDPQMTHSKRGALTVLCS